MDLGVNKIVRLRLPKKQQQNNEFQIGFINCLFPVHITNSSIKLISRGVTVSHPNNKQPNDQQRMSQDYLAKNTQSVEEFAKEQLTQGQAQPIASVQQKELT